ncbi:hypothetical protein FEM48_ZijujMtG0000300 (mitochondrion) [Ziziphus jujuba var. spinosa]|uniref:Uncharacterized protein n=1 Tax=Ziziphus jujuba var. spinosa TaxID=714518 RepID=A0A978UA56_ZIZJJ|nr:hypothetical protein FEM48_ZijujMtG0000300 [Ziziphus jujuba var. spinosa]
MDIVSRLSIIQQEIRQVESEKLDQEQMLGLLWEHPPALDPEIIGRVMQQIRDRIRALEERRRALLAEKQALIVEGAISNRRGNGNNRGN